MCPYYGRLSGSTLRDQYRLEDARQLSNTVYNVHCNLIWLTWHLRVDLFRQHNIHVKINLWVFVIQILDKNENKINS